MSVEDGERLAVVETRLEMLERDVREIKADVKVLVASSQSDAARREHQAAAGVWVRWAPQLLIAGLAALNVLQILRERL